MLTVDLLKQDSLLQGLSDEQLNTIQTLSAKDENDVIGKKVGELHGEYDKNIKEITGLDKPAGVKTYDFLKTTLSDYKSKAEKVSEYDAKINSLTEEINGYKKVIAEGKGSEQIAKDLKDAKDLLSQLQGNYEKDKLEWSNKEKGYLKEKEDIKFDFEFNKAVSELTLKKDYPDSVKQVLIDNAKKSILSKYTPEFVSTTEGNFLQFRDENGSIVLNPENKLSPFTIKELAANLLKESLDKTTSGGVGSNPPKDAPNTEISGAKTQVEADELIVKKLLADGLTKTNPEFARQQKEIRIQYKVDKLPLR